MTKLSILAAGLLLATAGVAHAQNTALPVGEWGAKTNHGLACNPPFLKIEPNRIVKRLGGGEGRCPIGKIKRKGSVLFVDAKCKYDKSISPESLELGDDDDDSFSLKIISPTQILFNNTPHELCSPGSGGVK